MMILLTGGSSCGKSFYGERLCAGQGQPLYYISAARYFQESSGEKNVRHREHCRENGFEVIEQYSELSSLVLPRRGCALLECICNLTANEMFAEDGSFTDPFDRVVSGVLALNKQCHLLTVVTNDVDRENEALYDPGTRAYMQALGRINAALAEYADTVLEFVCGIPIVLKADA